LLYFLSSFIGELKKSRRKGLEFLKTFAIIELDDTHPPPTNLLSNERINYRIRGANRKANILKTTKDIKIIQTIRKTVFGLNLAILFYDNKSKKN